MFTGFVPTCDAVTVEVPNDEMRCKLQEEKHLNCEPSVREIKAAGWSSQLSVSHQDTLCVSLTMRNAFLMPLKKSFGKIFVHESLSCSVGLHACKWSADPDLRPI